MDSYPVHFDQIGQGKELGDMLQALERGFQKFSIDYYLVGAVSRDVWMSGIHRLRPRRTTGDIDFAVLINDKGLYEQLKDYLITKESFTACRENAFVLIYQNGIEVDLLPFGAVEDEDRKVTIRGTGYTSIHVDGFQEVYDQMLPHVNLDGHVFKFCSLAGIVLLKLIAWEDRPEARSDDIKDIADILHNYFTMNAEVIWASHTDLFADEDQDLVLVAARVLGREMGVITSRSVPLHDRILRLLDSHTRLAETSAIVLLLRQYFDTTIEACVALLAAMQMGVLESRSPRTP
jgi:predicted nucleotidyltransferase